MRQTCLRRLKTSPRHLQNFNVGVIWRNLFCEKYDLQGSGTAKIELLYILPLLFLSTVLKSHWILRHLTFRLSFSTSTEKECATRPDANTLTLISFYVLNSFVYCECPLRTGLQPLVVYASAGCAKRKQFCQGWGPARPGGTARVRRRWPQPWQN